MIHIAWVRHYQIKIRLLPGQGEAVSKLYNEQQLARVLHVLYAPTNRGVVIERHTRPSGMEYLRAIITDEGEKGEGVLALQDLIERLGLEFDIRRVTVR